MLNEDCDGWADEGRDPEERWLARDERRTFNEGVLYALRYQLAGMRGEVKALEGRISTLEDCLEHPERQSPYEVWLSEQPEK